MYFCYVPIAKNERIHYIICCLFIEATYVKNHQFWSSGLQELETQLKYFHLVARQVSAYTQNHKSFGKSKTETAELRPKHFQ